MLFNSITFLIFFPIVTTLYFLATPPSTNGLGNRWIVLLISSCIFYMWFIPKYILVLAVLVVVDYTAGIFIEKSEPKKKKIFLYISIFTTCGILFVFKYFNFFNENMLIVAKNFGLNYPQSTLDIILPLGLSFHTFQSLSYVIEVYRGNQKAERHLGIFALYVMFYPQLCAGPIERPQNLLFQFRENYRFDYERITNGLKIMAWGLFKKVIIADRLGILVNNVYGAPSTHNGVVLTLATFFFAFQIYCDFSGYTDIAIGSSQVMGFTLKPNFVRPYFSKSISEYWRRWHISLSSWFRDYVYISLGGKKKTKMRWYFNLLVTFLLSGLWHGANWTFITWGAINGFYLVFSLWTRDQRSRLIDTPIKKISPFMLKLYQVMITFSLVCIGRIFTRASTISEAVYIFTHLGTGWGEFVRKIWFGKLTFTGEAVSGTGLGTEWLLISFALIGLINAVDLLQRNGSIRKRLATMPVYIRWSIYLTLSYTVAWHLLSMEAPKQEFIYFQF